MRRQTVALTEEQVRTALGLKDCKEEGAGMAKRMGLVDENPTYSTFDEWFDGNLSQSAFDIANGGAAGGFPGITTYAETTALYNAFESSLWDTLTATADDMGVTPLALMASFGGADMVQDGDTFHNLLVWFAAEERAQSHDGLNY